MDTIIQSQLDRVETALNTLIDSITKYNPSIPATSALLSADDELNRGLKQLAIHQSNHARIQQLRGNIDRRNENITSAITTLASTRANLLETPTSLPAEGTRKVNYTELLDYAKRIGKYTVPPTYRAPVPAQPAPAVIVNGNGNTNGIEVAAKEGEAAVEGDREGRGAGELDDVERNWLDPLKQMPFVPWVSDQVMRSGALAEIQAMVERGENPEIVQVCETEEKTSEETLTGDAMEDVQGESVARAAGAPVVRQERREEKPKVFGGLDLYDPDSPDEE
ncbi:hypothetical protein P7C71_g2020, partial [Lecanoromycetidae sp. Uapishka_2]